jgi:hypothetical protein
MATRPESEEPGPIEFDFIDGAVVRRAPKAAKTETAAPKVQSTVEPTVPRTRRTDVESSAPPASPAPTRPAAAQPTPTRPAPEPARAPAPVRTPDPVSASKPAPAPSPAPRAETPKPAPTPAPPAARSSERASTPSQTSSTPERTMPTPHTIDDFRRNAERQSKEQKTFGNVLATITYSILIAFVLVTALAGYGGYILLKRIRTQETSLAELDHRYEAELVATKEDLKRTSNFAQQLQGDLARQQEQISRLGALAAKSNSDLVAARKDIATLQNQMSQVRSTNAGAR